MDFVDGQKIGNQKNQVYKWIIMLLTNQNNLLLNI